MSLRTEQLFEELITHTLQTRNVDSINRALKSKKYLMNNLIEQPKTHSISTWVKIWSSKIEKKRLNQLVHLRALLPKSKKPIYNLINSLILTGREYTIKNQESDFRNPIQAQLSVNDILNDLLVLLQLGEGNFLHTEGDGFVIRGIAPIEVRPLLQKTIPIVLGIQKIASIGKDLVGNIGQAIKEIFDQELYHFIEYTSKFSDDEISILSLKSKLCGTEVERIMDVAFLAFLVTSQGMNYITALSYSQSHGNKQVQEIGIKMIEHGFGVIIEFVKDWVVYGSLNDPYQEFFVKENDFIPNGTSWWSSKFSLVPERLPASLIEIDLAKKIVSCGRAWNFIQTFKPKNSTTDIEPFKRKRFDLSMVSVFSERAMKAVLDLVIVQADFKGHAKVIYDFLLYARGDFASTLFSALSETANEDMWSILPATLHGIDANGKYINKVTGENLLSYLDLKMKDTKGLEFTLVYNPPEPVNTIFNRSTMEKYGRVSALLWKMRSVYYDLAVLWKNQLTLPFIEELEFDMEIDRALIKIIMGTRHQMLYAITTLNEWLFSEVVYSSHEEFMKRLDSVKTFDELVHAHKQHMDHLFKGTLMAKRFSRQQTALSSLVSVFDKFLDDLSDCIRYLNDTNEEYLYMKDNNDMDENFIPSATAEFKEFIIVFESHRKEFTNKLQILYEAVSDLDQTKELALLQNRLHFCFTNRNYPSYR